MKLNLRADLLLQLRKVNALQQQGIARHQNYWFMGTGTGRMNSKRRMVLRLAPFFYPTDAPEKVCGGELDRGAEKRAQ
ncbi:MAG TPA: hypothetical protein VJQ50_09280 [Terriglobales bacterium]|nr:hypothetical protein [Terriglobales bacterium]